MEKMKIKKMEKWKNGKNENKENGKMEKMKIKKIKKMKKWKKWKKEVTSLPPSLSPSLCVPCFLHFAVFFHFSINRSVEVEHGGVRRNRGGGGLEELRELFFCKEKSSVSSFLPSALASLSISLLLHGFLY